MTDVVDLIEQDHREVEQLFVDFGSSASPAIAERICNELTKHTFGEERAVYPVVARRLSDGKDLSDEAVEEHREARQLIGRIRNTSDPATLSDLMKELEAAIQHHVREEETEMLPEARAHLSAEDLEAMARDFEQAKESAAQRSS
jgi:hemerythrin superfamily protein